MNKEDLEDMGIKKLTLKFLPAVIAAGIGGILYSCGTGGGAENGASVVVELKSVSPSTIQLDLYDQKDNNNDTICDYYTVPTEDTFLDAVFYVQPINEEKINPSDVNIYKYKLSFAKENSFSPKLKPVTFNNMTCTAVVGKDTTCKAVAVPLNLKLCLLNYIRVKNIQKPLSYTVNIKFYGNEIIYDNDLDITGKFRFDAGQFLNENDDNCTGNPSSAQRDCTCCQYIDDADYCAGC
ncbi:hypothetical protein [Persephonella sp. KM09-Lau-8]|uniref:hypothetical protein n=1 Tax=Persephonella sp. KM09-Lau-8 TaxID=1158345 RepID=UPI000495492F|nr:hypothetical protein [Persephonella sp. KM09-Lau-8]